MSKAEFICYLAGTALLCVGIGIEYGAGDAFIAMGSLLVLLAVFGGWDDV